MGPWHAESNETALRRMELNRAEIATAAVVTHRPSRIRRRGRTIATNTHRAWQCTTSPRSPSRSDNVELRPVREWCTGQMQRHQRPDRCAAPSARAMSGAVIAAGPAR